MAVKIRLKRMGKVRVPQYRIVVVDSRKKRDGRVIEEIGKYHPKEEPSLIDVVSDRAQYWLGVGAQPTETVQSLLSVTGDWQKFKGSAGTEGRLKHAAEKRSKLDIFNEALKEAGSESVAATTPKSSAKDEKKDEKAAPAATETPAVETPEGATEQAEVEETKALDAEKQQEPEDGAKGDADGTDAATPSS
ncbi:30S ribosomal protein S16 [Nocardioides lentus]|uniref:Small ribosomal subunit protein bS16 n=1 Tax=Nocardioides lentus TaxID=338077 RepID=A0ABN2PL52_9ACTN